MIEIRDIEINKYLINPEEDKEYCITKMTDEWLEMEKNGESNIWSTFSEDIQAGDFVLVVHSAITISAKDKDSISQYDYFSDNEKVNALTIEPLLRELNKTEYKEISREEIIQGISDFFSDNK